MGAIEFTIMSRLASPGSYSPAPRTKASAALFTRMSTGPCAASTRPMASATALSSARSRVNQLPLLDSATGLRRGAGVEPPGVAAQHRAGCPPPGNLLGDPNTNALRPAGHQAMPAVNVHGA